MNAKHDEEKKRAKGKLRKKICNNILVLLIALTIMGKCKMLGPMKMAICLQNQSFCRLCIFLRD